MRIHAVFNRDGGTFRTTDMQQFSQTAKTLFEERGHEFSSEIVSGKDIVKAMQRVAGESGEPVLMAGGGDGTISAAADIAWKAGIPLAVLPAGTMNLFARALKIPLDLTAALESLATGEIIAVDISTANDESFVHQFSIGFQPQMIEFRNTLEYSSRWGKRLASLRAFAKAVSKPPNFKVRMTLNGKASERKVSAVSVANNPYGQGMLPVPDKLGRGELGIYIARKPTPASIAKLALSVFTGSWRDHPDVEEKFARTIELHFPHLRKHAKATIDGELIQLPRDVKIQIHPGELKVLVPRSPGAEEADS
ncbi:diacylglycerol kinase family lipid kinase [Phyllobacterium sp. 0TCS1.6C]|uniref:diacylglycerol/lipid kinase family protein n=1 Tax=unclassified Phyllobacterium TaxID=2638441 RepID=UPI0022651804|nr:MULTISPECIES: diacylglycerol kinase family protein [unclassified Phyllobacterium]MCX8279351.1 diacylglycerol kinase family lipid kinase [Phyllobacterium sp. 0TCS1.6C]MCX8292458.1 diacylglycerol kinase family lipid kinase [Phyllobacterium sp. 0TCS1.6A]